MLITPQTNQSFESRYNLNRTLPKVRTSFNRTCPEIISPSNITLNKVQFRY